MFRQTLLHRECILDADYARETQISTNPDYPAGRNGNAGPGKPDQADSFIIAQVVDGPPLTRLRRVFKLILISNKNSNL